LLVCLFACLLACSRACVLACLRACVLAVRIAKPAAKKELKTLGDLNNWFSCQSLECPITEQRKTEESMEHKAVWEVKYSDNTWLQINLPVPRVIGPNTKKLKHELSRGLITIVNSGHWYNSYTRPDFTSPQLWNDPPQEEKINTASGNVVKLRRMAADDGKGASFDEEVYALIERNSNGFIGFDCERDTHTQRTTLIQLADDFVILLYQPPRISEELPAALAQLLGNSLVTKMVIDQSHDVKYLKIDFNVACHGVLDLQEMAKEFGFFKASTEVLAEYFLRYSMTKDKETAVSFTERSLTKRLSAEQIRYGALDAVVAHELGRKLLSIDATNTRNGWNRCVYLGTQPHNLPTNRQ
jgi:hypothetical protein